MADPPNGTSLIELFCVACVCFGTTFFLEFAALPLQPLTVLFVLLNQRFCAC